MFIVKNLLFAVVAVGVMPTVDAFAGGLIAVVGEAVAVARLACGELPEVGLTLVAVFALDLVVAVALAGFAVAKVVLRAA